MKLRTPFLKFQASGNEVPAKECGRIRSKDDESTRGTYAPLKSTSSVRKGGKVLQIFPTVALLFVGIALMITHHFFFAYLNGKIIDGGGSELPPTLRDQTAPNVIGTTVAHGARIAFSMVVNATLVQLFWETLRSRSHTIRQIDGFVECIQSPFRLSAIRAVSSAPLLLILSAIASAMNLIVVLSPGSLAVSSTFQRSKSCIVTNGPNTTNTKFDYVDMALLTAVEKISTTGSYIPPIRANVCDPGASSCSYNVSFVGPAFDCFDVTDRTDFTSFLEPALNSGDNDTLSIIWNVTGVPPNLFVMTLDMVNNVTQANNCTVYKATYEVGITLDEHSATAHVWNVTLGSVGSTNDVVLLDDYISYALDFLSGIVAAGPDGSLESSSLVSNNQLSAFTEENALLDSKIFVVMPSRNHTWSDNVTNVLTSYMQNVSLSLLSGDVYYKISNNNVSSELLNVNSTCSSTWDAYVYSPARLLATYGAALALTSLTILPGCWLTLRNGVEEKVMISSIIKYTLNSALFDTRKVIEGGTIVHLEEITSGRLAPAHPSRRDETQDPGEVTKFSSSNRSMLKQLRMSLQSCDKQMTCIVCLAVCCMIIHHYYNSFLDGKSPSSSSGILQNWIRDQSVVSDIGIAVSYTVQTLLTAAIAISSSQLFWRSLRAREHSISQIDSLMRAQSNAFSPSIFQSGPASWKVVLASLLSSSMPLLSIFAPNSIKVAFNHHQTTNCTVMTPRNLTALQTPNTIDYSLQTTGVFLSQTYLPPANPCSVALGSHCSYTMDFIGPAFVCNDVTASSDYTAFVNATILGVNLGVPYNDTPTTNLWLSSLDVTDNREVRLSVQMSNVQQSIYQAINCTSVSRKYSLQITHNSSSTIEVIDSSVIAPALVSPGTDTAGVLPFMQQYIRSSMTILEGGWAGDESFFSSFSLFQFPNLLGSVLQQEENGSVIIAWNENMIEALEQYAQNATLSLLSGQIFATDSPDGPSVLEESTTTCDYTYTAYEYTPSRLFTAYGVAIFATSICVIAGMDAVKKNGVDESMAFSRFLRAVLNERMYGVREKVDMDLMIKADDDEAGCFAPFLETKL